MVSELSTESVCDKVEIMDTKPVVLKSEDSSSSPFFKPKFNFKMLGVLAVVLISVVGVGAGVYLTGNPLPFMPKAQSPQQSPFPSLSPLPIITQPITSSTGSTQLVSTETALLASPTASASAEPDIYDFNTDGAVNTVDLSFMYANWGTAKSESGIKADLNADGVVNGVDYAMLLKRFN